MTNAERTRPPDAHNRPRKWALFRGIALAGAMLCIVGCDQVTKRVATEALAGTPTQSHLFDVLRLSYIENPGSFLSLGASLPEPLRFLLFTVGVPLLLVLVVLQAVRARWSGARLVGLAIAIAGGVSNWMDRLSDGRVVDFLNIGIGPVRTGIFNFADVAILLGLLIWLWRECTANAEH